MIVEFSVKNFRSIKEMQTISFVATGLKSADKYAEVDKNNIVEKDGMRLFKTLGIYGANASGKSNVLKALSYFTQAISEEPSSKSNLGLLAQPFLFQKDNQYSETFLQIVFYLNEEKYRYGLTAKWNEKPQNGDLNYSEQIITNEWLYGRKEKNMRLLFKRSLDNIDNKMPTSEKIPDQVPFEHSLIINYAAALNSNGMCGKIKNYLKHSYSNNSLKLEKFRDFSVDCSKGKLKHLKKQRLLDLLSIFNLDFNDFWAKEKLDTDLVHPRKNIFLIKNNTDQNSKISLNLHFNESSGTQKLFDLAGLLLFIFYVKRTPSLLILDEIESHFHSSLVIKLVTLFNNPKINKNNVQLLFTSHDTNLMSPSIMRRDQFYFTEKNEDDSTRLYSLADLKGIKDDADFARQYLAGYYGAVPVLKDYVAPQMVENE